MSTPVWIPTQSQHWPHLEPRSTASPLPSTADSSFPFPRSTGYDSTFYPSPALSVLHISLHTSRPQTSPRVPHETHAGSQTAHSPQAARPSTHHSTAQPRPHHATQQHPHPKTFAEETRRTQVQARTAPPPTAAAQDTTGTLAALSLISQRPAHLPAQERDASLTTHRPALIPLRPRPHQRHLRFAQEILGDPV
jgi:hypothetical protein